jgi:hypothetical protein
MFELPMAAVSDDQTPSVRFQHLYNITNGHAFTEY